MPYNHFAGDLMQLHGYWRSGTSYRTRIALNLKGLAYNQITHDLRLAQHRDNDYLALNPQGLVPALEIDGMVLVQSPSIMEWLEERYPDPPLLPNNPSDRAIVRSMAAIIGCDIHPLNNLRVLTALRSEFGADQTRVTNWVTRWIVTGFEALEILIAQHGAGYAFGDRPTLADAYLVPQVYSAERFGVALHAFPALVAAAGHARSHPSIAAAAPELQPDADAP